MSALLVGLSMLAILGAMLHDSGSATVRARRLGCFLMLASAGSVILLGSWLIRHVVGAIP